MPADRKKWSAFLKHGNKRVDPRLPQHPLRGSTEFLTGVTDGYLLVDADNNGSFGSAGDYAIVLDHLNSTTLFGPADVI